MPDVFLGSMLLVPYNFVPNGFALCNGQMLQITQNTALFSLLGTQFGGDGITTFALPNHPSHQPERLKWIIAMQGVYPSRG